MESTQFDLTSLTADIVSAYVANNALTGEKIPELISSVYGALSRASRQAVEPEPVELKPAVTIKKSVTSEYIICLEDGQKFKSLKRHLKTHYECLRKSTVRSGDCRAIIRWLLRAMPLHALIWRKTWDWGDVAVQWWQLNPRPWKNRRGVEAESMQGSRK